MIAIIVILITLLLPFAGSIRAKAQRANCINNLKSLYVAANLYTQEQGHWPQVNTATYGTQAFAQSWSDALSRYGIMPVNWICPTIQSSLGNPDVNKPGAVRVDYIGTPFGLDSQAPYRYTTQPWFIEKGDMHGDGNMIIFASGQIASLAQVRLFRPVSN